MSKLDNNYPDLRSDTCIQLRNRIPREEELMPLVNGFVPLLIVEVSRESLHPKLPHKDESKLAVAMGASLLRQLEICMHLGLEFAKRLRVYGILVGSCNFGTVVLYPDFKVVEDETSAQHYTFTMVYRSSRRYRRFSLFKPKSSESISDLDPRLQTESAEATIFNYDPNVPGEDNALEADLLNDWNILPL
jgi:hypothetical protein